MNKRAIAIILAIVALVILVAGGLIWKRRQATHVHSATEQGSNYYCPMHTSITSNKPGSCPICNMKLVKRSPSKQADVATQIAGSANMDESVPSINLSPEQRTLANVRTAKVALTSSTSELVTTGRVTFDERRVAQITSYTAGRIEQLYVNFTGDTVTRGRAVATIYSPDLYSTQQEYLLALANRQRMSSAGFAQARTASGDLVDSTRRRLQLFGMTSTQIDRLASGGKPFFTTTISSPVSGIVTQKLVLPQQYVAQGQALFQVADLSAVWVEADVYERDLAQITVGQRVAITAPSLPGVTLPGKVAFIQPTVGETRATRVRIELPNSNLQLKPDMYVSVRLFSDTGRQSITVPATAMIDRGQKQFVWVEVSSGNFAPRQITVGARTSDRIEILTGLKAGEVIAIEGGFLLDSEAQLRGAATR